MTVSSSTSCPRNTKKTNLTRLPWAQVALPEEVTFKLSLEKGTIQPDKCGNWFPAEKTKVDRGMNWEELRSIVRVEGYFTWCPCTHKKHKESSIIIGTLIELVV